MLASTGYTYDALSRGVHGDPRQRPHDDEPVDSGATRCRGRDHGQAAGVVVEGHAYTYDTHNNVATRTDTTPTVAPTSPGAKATETWTTAYRYDAYNRLLGSAVYPGVDGERHGDQRQLVHPRRRRRRHGGRDQQSHPRHRSKTPRRGNGSGNGNGNGNGNGKGDGAAASRTPAGSTPSTPPDS